jgi:hypothetical protein
LRIVWEYRKIDWILVLILILKKTDKKYWNNLVWSKEVEDKIWTLLPKILKNLEDNNYKVY